mgnify:CR=1 FL=1
MTFKKTKVVMLPTNQQAIVYLALNPATNKIRGIFNNDILLEYQRVGYETFHLYFTTNERPKVGDYCIDGDTLFGPYEEGDIPVVGFDKIIATTTFWGLAKVGKRKHQSRL